jgi:hypothetical protein
MAITRVPPTVKEALAKQALNAKEQREAAAARRNAVPPVDSTAIVPAKPTAVTAPAPDTRTNVQRYIDDIAPSMIAGRLIKFDGKKGAFLTRDDDEPVKEDTEFIALADETLVGWVKFNGENTPPSRAQGLLYGGFVMPARETLGDNDPDDWPAGLDDKPQDPWLHQILLPLAHAENRELFTFDTTSITGRRAIGNLLRSFDRMRTTSPDEVPVIKLKVGGFAHRDERIGWVNTPVFVIVGRTKRDAAAKPDTSLATQMDDEIPFK